MVKTGIATQRVSPREVAMSSEDIDISETSNSAKRSCRQNISEGCTMVGTSLIPCGTTRPSMSGRVRSLSESAMLSSRWGAVMGCDVGWAKSPDEVLSFSSGGERFCPRGQIERLDGVGKRARERASYRHLGRRVCPPYSAGTAT